MMRCWRLIQLYWRPAGLWRHCCAAGALIGCVLAIACTTVEPAGRSIAESPDTVVRLESQSTIASQHDSGPTQTASLTREHIEVLLNSISARNKTGLLRSFAGDPGMPRLFSPEDIRQLSGPLQEAFARARADDAVVFYRARPEAGGRRRVTSGTMVVRENTLFLAIANFWHPLITTAPDVGSTDRLHDIRETTGYVRDHPWVSVGEQDFAVFFDDSRYQTGSRHGSLFDYPERALSIAYQSYLQTNPDPVRRAQGADDAIRQATPGNAGSQTITELKQRVADLERMNAELAAQRPKGTAPAESSPSPAQESAARPGVTLQPQDRIQEFVQRLEERVTELERALKEDGSHRN